MPNWLKTVFQILVFAIALFAVGLLTRLPALYFSEFYALHALLAAPFYALLISAYLTVRKSYIPILFASLLYCLCLGSMQIVMGVSVFGSLLLSLLGYLFLQKVDNDRRSIVVGCLFGLAAYPTTLIAGFFFGSYSVLLSAENVLQIVITILLAAALSLIGTLAGLALGKYIESVGQKRKTRSES